MKELLIFWVICLGTYSFRGVKGCPASMFHTKYEEQFGKKCLPGHSLVNMASIFDSNKEDRIWHYTCRENKYITTSCRWSLPANQYVNSHNGAVNFICSGEGYMVGMYGETHDSDYGDRRFDFKCCDAKPLLGQTGCQWTDYVNDWEKNFNYEAPSGYFIAGISSTHKNLHQDRRWKFYICK